MANTTVSIRERIKTADERWVWTPKIPIPEGKLKPAEAERKGKFYLVWTENGKKRETKVKAQDHRGFHRTLPATGGNLTGRANPQSV